MFLPVPLPGLPAPAPEKDIQALMDYIAATLDGQVDEGYEDPYGQERIVSVGAEK